MTMFETRILCKRLPQSINKLDELLPLNNSIVTQGTSIQNKTLLQQELNKKYAKEVRHFRRDVLYDTLKKYENMIEEDEHLYQAELYRFEFELFDHAEDLYNLMTYLNEYLNHYTNKMIRRILYQETIFRRYLNHSYHYRKSTSASSKPKVNVFPDKIIEIPEDNLFTDKELTLLFSAGLFHYLFPVLVFHLCTY